MASASIESYFRVGSKLRVVEPAIHYDLSIEATIRPERGEGKAKARWR